MNYRFIQFIFNELGHGLFTFFAFVKDIIKKTFLHPIDFRLVFQQMEFIGVKSFFVIVLASVMIGAVFGIQFGKIFQLFGAESMIGAAAAFALSKELAPVVGSFLVTGRAGSAMAAEIATMRINEQIDAMRVMAVDPISYLCIPRVLASMIMMPLLSGIFLFFGILSAFFMSVWLFNIDVGVFLEKIQWITTPAHVVEGLEKAMFFGAIFSVVGCYKGFYAYGGAKAVGKATTQAVVLSLVAILIADFFISYLKQL